MIRRILRNGLPNVFGQYPSETFRRFQKFLQRSVVMYLFISILHLREFQKNLSIIVFQYYV